jgi:hypothetical protein
LIDITQKIYTGTPGPVVKPAPLSQTSDDYISSGAFAAVIVVLLLVFIVVILGLIYFIYRR